MKSLRKSDGRRAVFVENLEQRTLLAGTSLIVAPSKADASERLPTTSGRGVFVFTRTTGSAVAPLTVKYAVNGGSTATPGLDFTALSGKVVIPAGKRSVAINLYPVDDALHESTESITISLKNQSTYTVTRRNAVLTIRDNDAAVSTAGWWDTDHHFRAPITVSADGFTRADHTVDRSINFTSILQQAGATGGLIEDSIRVIETNANSTAVVDANVPFQFDRASNFNASTNASGNLAFVVKGNTNGSATRRYHVYFDVAGAFTPFNFSSQVTTTENDSDQGRDAYKIETNTATYWLQKENGGFSSIEDSAGNDWLGFNPTPGSESGGEFRGTPNAVFPGGGFHAGFDIGSSEIISSGPLKTVIESTVSVDKQIPNSPFIYKMRYEFYGNFVRATMVEAGHSYWFLYEGTPGGSVDGNDTVVRSDGTVTDISTTWNDNDGLGTDNDEEWVYFRDSAVNKYMYFVHNTPDDLIDSYFRQDNNGSMTVFGFGRDNHASDDTRQRISAQNNAFTFGIADGGGNFGDASEAINGVYRSVAVTTGAGQRLS